MVATKSKNDTSSVPKAQAMAEKRDKLLETLSPEAQQRVRRVGEWFSRADRAALKERYELGRDVKALYEYETDNGTGHYGLRFIASLCEAFGWDKGVVYGALAVAEVFTEEQITALYDRPLPSGRLIPYGHLRALAKVTGKKTRETLLDKAIARGWTREELEDAILKATTGQKKEDGRGRPLKAPKDLRGLLRQQERTAEEFVRRASEVWETPQCSLLRQVKKLPDKEVTEEQIKKLQEHAAFLRQLVEKADEQADEAERAAAYLQKKLAETAGAASASADAEQPRSDGA